MSYMKNLMIDKMNEERQAQLHALSLLKKADEETLWLMFRFLHDEEFIRGHILSMLNQATEKQLSDFIIFFGEK